MALNRRTTRARAWFRDERGEAGTKTSDLLLFGTVSSLLLAVFLLLVQTLSFAESIRKKTVVIATTGRGINDVTDSVLLLTRINKNVDSINGTVTPIEGQLREVLSLATGLDTKVASIVGNLVPAGKIAPMVDVIQPLIAGLNATVGGIGSGVASIGGTVGKINPQAKVIDKEVATILGQVKMIEADVNTIVGKLDTTIGGVTSIKADTGNIVTGVAEAKRLAGCIYKKIGGTPADTTKCGS